jgi:phage tail tape-measure protein
MAGKLAKPIGMAMDVYDFGSSALQGDAKGMGSSAGSLLGGMGGAWGGAAAGAAIGSIVPFVGTAIGGVIGAALGGWFGSSGGSALGAEIAENLTKKSDGTGSGATTRAQELAAWFRGEKPALTAEQAQPRELKANIGLAITGLPPGVSATATSQSSNLDVQAKSGFNMATAFG